MPPSWEGDRNDLALEAARLHPDRFAVMGRLDLRDPGSRALVADWKKAPGMLGMRFTFHNQHNRHFLTDGTADWLWPAAEAAGIPLMVLLPGSLDVLDRIAGRHPGLNLVIDHVGVDIRQKAPVAFEDLPAVCALAKHPNVAVKASGLPSFSTEPYPFRDVHDAIRRLVDAFGPRRTFWGTDLTRMPCSYRECIDLFAREQRWLKGEDLEWVMGRGVCQWLGWPCPRRDRHEIHLVPPDAVAVAAGRLPREAPLASGSTCRTRSTTPRGPRGLQRIPRQLEYADELGFDGIGVNEHHQNAYGMMPSPNLMAAALARRTSEGDAVVLGNSIALYNPPMRVAEEFAMLDVISGGRLIAGFPVGTPMDTNYCYGQNPALTREKYREAHDLIIKAWASDEPFALNGKYTKLRYVNCWPQPIQKPHPPIWIPGGGSIETWDFCVDHDYNYCYLSFSGYKRGKKMLDGYWERWPARQGRIPYRAAFAQSSASPTPTPRPSAIYAEHVDYFFNRCLHVPPGVRGCAGLPHDEDHRGGELNQFRAEPARFTSSPGRSWSTSGYVIAGSPETVRERWSS